MNLKKKTPAVSQKLPAGGQRLSLSDFETRETSIISSNKLDMISGGDSQDANPRPPLIVIVRR